MLFCRLFVGHRARRVYLALFLFLFALSIGVRVRSYLLTRRIYSVLSGLDRLRVDATTEEQLLRTVPYLVREKNTLPGTQGYYRAEISNQDDRRWLYRLPSFLSSLWPPHVDLPMKNKWDLMDLPTRIAYVLGWRHVSFSAYVFVLNGTVSSTGYSIEPDVLVGYPLSYFVVARSAHGFWRNRGREQPVQNTDDESPDYRFGAVAGQFSLLAGADSAIGVVYTATAPRDLVSRVYQVDLSCFWAIRGCGSVRQVTPFLWQDRRAIATATTRRVSSMAGWSGSGNPCPDRILAGRVRTVLDLNVALLEVVNSRSERVNREGIVSEEIVTDYRLIEAIRGQPQGPWTNIRYRWTIPWPFSPRGETLNPMRPSYPKPGERFLYFSGASFDSCRIVPATPSAESSVRSAVPAPRRSEDDITHYLYARM